MANILETVVFAETAKVCAENTQYIQNSKQKILMLQYNR